MKRSIAQLIKEGEKGKMPTRVQPMLCTLTAEVNNDPAYLFEIKWDGYRIMSYVQQGKVRLDSRGGKDYTAKYPLVAKALKALKVDVILDGEMVVFDEEGHPSFNGVQLYNGHDTPIFYYVFDILWLEGYDLRELPLTKRKGILRELIKGNGALRISESFENGEGLFHLMKEKGFEGIVAKRKDSQYIEDDRSLLWLKIPIKRIDEFVIGGWAESDKVRSFRSILFGAYDDGQLKWVGRSGGGFKERDMPGILKKLQQHEIKESPFINPVLDTKGAVIHWTKPELVGNFEYSEMTNSGRIRKPATWKGFRTDKAAKQVVLPVVKQLPKRTKKNSTGATDIQQIKDIPTKSIQAKKAGKKNPSSSKKKLKTSPNSNWPAVESQNQDDKTEFELADCAIDLFNVDREIWKGITKAELIRYYHSIAHYILPHIKDRPQSLHVKLYGAHAPGLYIKDMEGRQPDCATIFPDKRRHAAAGKRATIEYLVCNNQPTLLWMINIGCIDINPWNSRMQAPDEPDWIVIDLDPSEEKRTAKGLDRLRNTAMAAKDYCDSRHLTAFCKTSGKTGLHFLIPCSGIKTPEARSLAEKICADIHALVPDDSTIAVSKNARKGKVFVDFSQNDYADTIAAPYSVRPFHIPLVSTPLEWKEINNKLDPNTFTMKEIIKRLEKKGDLFAEILHQKNSVANNKSLQTIFAK